MLAFSPTHVSSNFYFFSCLSVQAEAQGHGSPAICPSVRHSSLPFSNLANWERATIFFGAAIIFLFSVFIHPDKIRTHRIALHRTGSIAFFHLSNFSSPYHEPKVFPRDCLSFVCWRRRSKRRGFLLCFTTHRIFLRYHGLPWKGRAGCIHTLHIPAYMCTFTCTSVKFIAF